MLTSNIVSHKGFSLRVDSHECTCLSEVGLLHEVPRRQQPLDAIVLLQPAVRVISRVDKSNLAARVATEQCSRNETPGDTIA